MRWWWLPALAPVLLASCASMERSKGPNVAKLCPARPVQEVLANRYAIEKLEIGVSYMQEQGKALANPHRQLAMNHPNLPPLTLLLFPTGIKGCPLVRNDPLNEAVVVDDAGLVVALGVPGVHDLAARGYTMPQMLWPWHHYDFVYLPKK